MRAALQTRNGSTRGVRSASCEGGTRPGGAGAGHPWPSLPDCPVRLVVFTSLYPSAVQPGHGRFVEDRLRRLVASGRVSATVVAPVPWFPFSQPWFGAYAAFARVPAHEDRHGIRVVHPRYPLIPKVGMNIAALLMYRWLLPTVRGLLLAGVKCDVIDSHYLYPDGVAAVAIGRRLGVPVVMSARGSDVNVLPRFQVPRRQIVQAACNAAAVVTVSGALSERLAALGIAERKLHVLRNGVDLDVFRPCDRGPLRTRLGVTGPTWLAVGHLIRLKGVHITLAALARVPDVHLMIAGTGPEEDRLRALVDQLGLGARVRFLGRVPHASLCSYYGAADALVLASRSEGMPNVALEALACGTPVIAAPFAGAAEVVGAPEAGEIARARTAEAVAAAWQRLVARSTDRAATRRWAERFGWGPTVDAQCELYLRVLATRHEGGSLGGAQP